MCTVGIAAESNLQFSVLGTGSAARAPSPASFHLHEALRRAQEIALMFPWDILCMQ